MNEIQFLVLKGRHKLAQGKRRRSDALGWRKVFKFVRVGKSGNEQPNIRTKRSFGNFLANIFLNSVRNMSFILNNPFSRTDSSSLQLPRAAFRIVPPETLPCANFSLAFQAGKNIMQLIDVKRVA